VLNKLIVRNFKKFDEVEIELGNPVIFIGPNNSGKTSALQALVLWDIGLRRWREKYKDRDTPEKRPGVTINRRDLVAVPVPSANLLWRDLHSREVQRIDDKPNTRNVFIDVLVEGITHDRPWKCGLEFYYANPESFYCRQLRMSDSGNPARMSIPLEAHEMSVAFLPPMSALAPTETRLDQGAINVRVGEGRTGEVLRNLCYMMIERGDAERWERLKSDVHSLFGVELQAPEYVTARGEIVMGYEERGNTLDLSCSGLGLQQTLLLLAYMYAYSNAVLLLDEPDAHLEFLRQRQIYQLLCDVAEENENQVIAASHSEVLLSEAAQRDVVTAFVGKPHRINDRGGQVLKALKEIGFEDYCQAEQTGWVLYLEGATDLAILRAFADKLGHEAARKALERPFVKYLGSNQPNEFRKHYHGLREALPNLSCVALFDRLEKGAEEDYFMWQRREIENYLCFPETLLAYAEGTAHEEADGPLFAPAEAQRRVEAMREAIDELEKALVETVGKESPWGPDLKVSDEFLTPLFRNYYKRLALPNLMAKKNFHELARFVPADKLDPEVKDKLDVIAEAEATAQASRKG